MSSRSNGMKQILDDTLVQCRPSHHQSITHWLRSMSRLSPADTVEALLYGGEAVVD